MRFSLVDQIEQLDPGSSITTVKCLTMAEEYLGDHFPGFPVMPGVLMLEVMTQTAAWLIRATDDFAHSMVLLKEARGVKYGQFVEPGQTLRVTVEIVSRKGQETTVKARGMLDGQVTLQGRLTLEGFNIADRHPEHAATDAQLKRDLRKLMALLCSHSDVVAQGGRNEP